MFITTPGNGMEPCKAPKKDRSQRIWNDHISKVMEERGLLTEAMQKNGNLATGTLEGKTFEEEDYLLHHILSLFVAAHDRVIGFGLGFQPHILKSVESAPFIIIIHSNKILYTDL
jgi:hypothetical protein